MFYTKRVDTVNYSPETSLDVAADIATGVHYYGADENYPGINTLCDSMYKITGVSGFTRLGLNTDRYAHIKQKAISKGARTGYELLATAKPDHLARGVSRYLQETDKKTFDYLLDSIGIPDLGEEVFHPELQIVINALDAYPYREYLIGISDETERLLENLATSAFKYTISVFDVIAFNEA